MNKFKPGDLAVVVSGKIPENIGRVVEIISYCDFSTNFVIDGLIFVNHKNSTGNFVAVKCEGIIISTVGGRMHRQNFAVYNEGKLMPLKSDGDQFKIEHAVKIKRGVEV